jgi:Zn-dependent protease
MLNPTKDFITSWSDSRTMQEIKHVNPHYKQGITTSEKEIKDLLKAWLILGLAFALVLEGPSFDIVMLKAFGISLLTIGLGFLFHELAHKFLAQRYGCLAEFRSFDQMLMLSLLISIFGVIFAAPGAVMIQGHLTKKQNGKISAAGPAMNIILALAFMPLFITQTGVLGEIGKYGFIINAWLALFNMIPFAMFDGKKVWDWSKTAYALMAIAALALVAAQAVISGAA